MKPCRRAINQACSHREPSQASRCLRRGHKERDPIWGSPPPPIFKLSKRGLEGKQTSFFKKISYSVGTVDVWYLLSPFPHTPTPLRGVLMKDIKWWGPSELAICGTILIPLRALFFHTQQEVAVRPRSSTYASWFWLTFISYHPALQQCTPLLGTRHYNLILGWQPAPSAWVCKDLPRTSRMRAPDK